MNEKVQIMIFRRNWFLEYLTEGIVIRVLADLD